MHKTEVQGELEKRLSDEDISIRWGGELYRSLYVESDDGGKTFMAKMLIGDYVEVAFKPVGEDSITHREDIHDIREATETVIDWVREQT